MKRHDSSPDGVVPQALFLRVRSDLEEKMNPGFFPVFFPILKAQVLLGALTLMVCPQFGIGPLGGGEGLMGWVESYGHMICGMYCGSIFVGLNVLYARFFLPLDLKNAIRRKPLLPFSLLGVISFFLLFLLSTMWNGRAPLFHVEFVGAWFLAFVLIPLAGLRLRFRSGIAE